MRFRRTMSLTFPLFTAGCLVPGVGTCFTLTFASQRFWFNSSSPGHFSPAEIAIFSVRVIVVAFAAFILGALSEKMKEYYARVITREKDALNTYHHVWSSIWACKLQFKSFFDSLVKWNISDENVRLKAFWTSGCCDYRSWFFWQAIAWYPKGIVDFRTFTRKVRIYTKFQ